VHDLSACTLSQVIDSFDLCNGDNDHSAVGLQLVWSATTYSETGPKKSRSFDRSKICKEQISEELRAISIPSWDTDIEQHIAQQTAQYLSCLRKKCAQSRGAPKKAFITQEIWSIRNAKLLARKQLTRIGQRQRSESLRLCFRAWSAGLNEEQAHCFFHHGTTLIVWRLHRVALQHGLAKQLKKCLRKARQHALSDALHSLPDDAPANAILNTVKQIVGPTNLKHIKRRALPMLRDEHGQICQHPDQILTRWIDFFGTMEGATCLDEEEQRRLWIANLQSFQNHELQLQPEDVPSLTDLELAVRRVKRHKATGPDGVPSELCCACPAQLARQLYGALLKLVCHGQESLSHKGGLLAPAFKGKGSHLDASAYRSLLVSSHIGKVLHRTVRQTQASLLESFMEPQQHGGKRHVPVTLGLHEARAYLRGNQQKSRSVALLLVDLTEAFYRVLRPLAVGCSFADDEIAALAKRLNLDTDTLHQLHAHLREDPAIAQAGMQPHYQNVIQALHTDTFFQLPGQSNCSRTTIGSRPGDSFADAAFSFLFARVMKTFQEKMREQGLLQFVADQRSFDPFHDRDACVQERPPIAYTGPIWMDDLCLCFSDPSCTAVMSKAQVATSLLLETFETHAMTPNLKAGKTELLVSLRGPGVRQLKTQLFGPVSDGTVPIVGEHKTQKLVVVGSYQHLGGLLHHAGDMRLEMRRRVAIGHQTLNRLKKSIFGNRHIKLERRVQLFESLVLSQLLYGCESWVIRAWTHKQFLHSAIIKFYKRVLGVSHDDPMCDEEICVKLNLPMPSELLRRARLRYLGTLHRCQDSVSWDVLHSDEEWCALVRDDLCWMWSQLATTTSLGNPSEDLAGWRYLWIYHGGYWKGLIKRACLHAALQRRNDFQVRQGHLHILHELATQHQIVPGALDCLQVSSRPIGRFGCLGCSKAFRSKAGEGAHMFRKHGVISGLRWLFDGTACPACLREYHSVGRLKAHLRQQEQCRRILQNRGALSQPCPGIGSQEHAAQVRAEGGLLPPLPGVGPLPCPVPQREIVEFDTDFLADIAEILLMTCPVMDKMRLVRAAGIERCLSWTAFEQTVQHAQSTCDEVSAAAYGFGSISDLHTFCGALLCEQNWDFFVEDKLPERKTTPTLADIEEAFVSSKVLPTNSLESPRAFGKHRLILHAFSGRRRHGDFQVFVEACAQKNPGVVLHVVSVDIVLSPVWGDVTRYETQQMWFDGIRRKYVVAYLAGPPCETWSQAREVQLEHADRRGPRVVRTLAELWGLGSLSVKELRQVIVGNELMLFSLYALVLLSGTGGCGALEHPAEPKKEDSASIWRTEIVRLLLQVEGFQLLTFAQGLLGAKSAKPTSLLTLNLPTMGQWIHGSRVCADLPAASSIGKSSSGHWNTMSLKEYPPALCRALGGCIAATASGLEIDAGCQIDPCFWDRCRTMVVDDFNQCIGPDYAP